MEIINESERNEKGQAYPKIPESNIGYQLLQKLGWKGGGLGREGNQGIEEPIVVNRKCKSRQGLGMKDVRKPSRQKHSYPSHQKKQKRKQPIIHTRFIKEFLKSDMNETIVKEELIDEDHRLLKKLCVKYGLVYDFVGPSKKLVIRKPAKQPSGQPGKTKREQQRPCQQKKLRTQPIINNLFIKTFLASNMKETIVKEELIDEDHRLLQKLCAKYYLEYDFVGPSNYLIIRKSGNLGSTQPGKKKAGCRHQRRKQKAQPIIDDPFIKEFLASDKEEIVIRDKFKVEDQSCLEKLCNKYFLVYGFVGPLKHLVIRKPVEQASAQLKEMQTKKEHPCCKKNKVKKQPIINNRFIKEFLSSNLKETIVREQLIDEDHRLLKKLCVKYCLKYEFVGPSNHLVIRKPVKKVPTQACQQHKQRKKRSISKSAKSTNSSVKKVPVVERSRLMKNAIRDATKSVAKSCRRYSHEKLVIKPNLPMVIAIRKSIVSALTKQTKSNDNQHSTGTKENSKQTSWKRELTSTVNSRKIQEVNKMDEGKQTIKELFAVKSDLPNPSLIPVNHLVEENRKRKLGDSCNDDNETKQKRTKVDDHYSNSPSTLTGLVSFNMGNQPQSIVTGAVTCVSFRQK